MDSTTLDDALNSMNTRDIFTYLGKNGLAWPKKIETDLHIARYRVSQSLDVLVTAETVGAERMSNFPRKKLGLSWLRYRKMKDRTYVYYVLDTEAAKELERRIHETTVYA